MTGRKGGLIIEFSSEMDEKTHRLHFLLVVAVLAEQVDAEADAGGGGQVSHGPPLLHLGCCNEKRGGEGLERNRGRGERRVACASVFQSALEGETVVVCVEGKKRKKEKNGNAS